MQQYAVRYKDLPLPYLAPIDELPKYQVFRKRADAREFFDRQRRNEDVEKKDIALFQVDCDRDDPRQVIDLIQAGQAKLLELYPRRMSAGEWREFYKKYPESLKDAPAEHLKYIDKDALAQAICQVLVKHGKKTQAECNSGYYVTVRQRLDNEPAYLRKALEVPEIAIAYAAILIEYDDLLRCRCAPEIER